MPRLIDRDGEIVDRWIPSPAAPAAIPPGFGALLPAARWRAERSRWIASPLPLGVRLEPHDEPAELVSDFPRLSLIAVAFPVFTDGRGYSLARVLRDRDGWLGELRAVGDILRDQLFYLARCGFDSFELADGSDAAAAVDAFSDYSVVYQAGARLPLSERRPAIR